MSEQGLFPKTFLWGVSTSAYQVEGSPLADGAGPNIWHRFSHEPGMTVHGATGDVACDHYRRPDEDIALMASLGVGAYRFSIAWARVLPRGRGRINARGLAFYDRLVDSLLHHEIVPCPTLYHWDLPLALEDRGGWLNDDTARWFGDYSDLIFRALGDRVPMWVTINEPAVVMEKGYVLGVYAPGHRNAAEAPVVARNLLRAHGSAVQAFRDRSDGRIGIACNIQPAYAATGSEADQAATRRVDAWRNRQFLDAIFLGQAPDELPDVYGPNWRPYSAEDLALIHQPTDFIGLNYYTRMVVGDDAVALPARARKIDVPGQHTLAGWEVYPDGLTETLLGLTGRYGRVPIYITECGAAFDDPRTVAGDEVPDPERVEFLRAHLRAALAARNADVDLRGFFVWSLLDNFEWNSGYTRPYGLVQVDFETQRRTMKTSARFFSEVIRSKGEALSEPVPA